MMAKRAPQIPEEFSGTKIVVFYSKNGDIILTQKLKDLDLENLPEDAAFYVVFKLNLTFEKVVPIEW